MISRSPPRPGRFQHCSSSSCHCPGWSFTRCVLYHSPALSLKRPSDIVTRRRRAVHTAHQPATPSLNLIPNDVLPMIAKHLHNMGNFSTLTSLQRVSHAAYDAVTPSLYTSIRLHTSQSYRSLFLVACDTTRKYRNKTPDDQLILEVGKTKAGGELPTAWMRFLKCMGYVRHLEIEHTPPRHFEPVIRLIGRILDYIKADVLMPHVLHFCPPWQLYPCGSECEDGGRLNRFLGSARMISPMDMCASMWGISDHLDRHIHHWSHFQRIIVRGLCMNDLWTFLEPNRHYDVLILGAYSPHRLRDKYLPTRQCKIKVLSAMALRRLEKSETLTSTWRIFLPNEDGEELQHIFRTSIDRVISKLRNSDYAGDYYNLAALELAQHLSKPSTISFETVKSGIHPRTDCCTSERHFWS